ncbi:MAG: SDR family oxidoreductase [Clostridia bacterium]|nr:SDR family oxidoreductase [Clostridia bacterium]
MRALITGASSGIGRDLAINLAKEGYDIVIVARSVDKLNELKDEIDKLNLNRNIDVVQKDLSNVDNCKSLYEQYKNQIDLLINNAGFGTYGKFEDVDLGTELRLIDTNISAVHVLTKLFLKDMKEKNKGQILNVASIAGFLPGPLMSAYYASKAYVIRLSQGIKEELRKDKSNVSISVLCPGPVDTNFNNVAKVKFNSKPLTSEYVAKYTIKKLKKKKFYIIPGYAVRALRHICKILPDNLMASFAYSHTESKK